MVIEVNLWLCCTRIVIATAQHTGKQIPKGSICDLEKAMNDRTYQGDGVHRAHRVIEECGIKYPLVADEPSNRTV
ncbi:unnamed protein product [Acidithrix sp. C25]|nr:unnamed protein product [Acidithrix sp. C25]